MKLFYRLYQLFIALPLGLIATVVTAVVTVVGCSLGGGHFWGYQPGKWWSRIVMWLLLLPVKTEGRDKLDKQQSYVFVANHQGAFDIFLVYGYLGRNFKWMMKQGLRKVPLVGWACAKSGQIFVDKRGPSKIRHTYDEARRTLKEGTSLMVFPEGARTFTGHMASFRRGAYALANELQLPIVPLTINGSFDVLPRQKGVWFVDWHPLHLTIHNPIMPDGQSQENIDHAMKLSWQVIEQSLDPLYRGFEANPDQ